LPEILFDQQINVYSDSNDLRNLGTAEINEKCVTIAILVCQEIIGHFFVRSYYIAAPTGCSVSMRRFFPLLEQDEDIVFDLFGLCAHSHHVLGCYLY
jgi:hypothetical protein